MCKSLLVFNCKGFSRVIYDIKFGVRKLLPGMTESENRMILRSLVLTHYHRDSHAGNVTVRLTDTPLTAKSRLYTVSK